MSRPPELNDQRLLQSASLEDSDTEPYGDRARVVAATDGTDAFETTPTVILCPNCGERLTTNTRGLPSVVAQFDISCESCEVDLRHWCAVAIDAAYESLAEPPTLTAMTQAYWNQWLWAGITNARGEPRNDEITARLSAKAGNFGWDWELSCPLCRRPSSHLSAEVNGFDGSLDYHHWSEQPDRGVTLCRECHDIIGFDCYDSELEQRAHDWGLRSRNDLQVSRLALRDVVATGRSLSPEISGYLVARYNLVQTTEEVSALLGDICQNSALAELLTDDRLYAGLNSG